MLLLLACNTAQRQGGYSYAPALPANDYYFLNVDGTNYGVTDMGVGFYNIYNFESGYSDTIIMY